MDGGVDTEGQIGGVQEERARERWRKTVKERVGLKEDEKQEGRMNMESQANRFALPLFFPSPSLLPPFLHLFYSHRGLPQPRKKSARSELADPSVNWLIAEVSLCQMTNRVSLPITNLPAGASP